MRFVTDDANLPIGKAYPIEQVPHQEQIYVRELIKDDD